MKLLVLPIILLLAVLPALSVAEQETINVLVLLVQWADHGDRALIPKSQIEQIWNGPGYTGDDVVPGESISEYIESNSYGKYKIEADVVDWFEVDQTEAEAANNQMGDPNSHFRQVVLPVIEHAADNGYDMSKYSGYNNNLWGVVFVHSGYDATIGGPDCETGAGNLDRIRSKSWGGTSNYIGTTGYKLYTFATMSAYRGNCGLKINRIGVPIHEWLHAEFALEDYYDTSGTSYGDGWGLGGIGAYDIMSFAGGQKIGKFQFPGLISPFNKMEMGVLDPIEITGDGTYFARPSALYPDIYIIKSPYPAGEYLLIENRQPLLSDIDIWSSGGIVIYHIDENVGGYGNKYRGGPFLDGWPGNGDHYKVAVLQADGNYDLERNVNVGDAGDFWKPGQMLGPGNGELVATDSGTYPNTDSYMNGNIQVTGVKIDNLNDEGDGVWSFRVSNLGTATPTTQAPAGSPGDSEDSSSFRAKSTVSFLILSISMLFSLW